MDPGLVRKCLLAPAFRFAKAAQIAGEALTYVHVALKTPSSTIDLQTISDIPVDLPRTIERKGCH